MSAALAVESQVMPLVAMAKSERGTIRSITADGEELERLAGLGLCAGRRVELVKVGHPMILRVYGTQIGLSQELASNIEIDRETEPLAQADWAPALS